MIQNAESQFQPVPTKETIYSHLSPAQQRVYQEIYNFVWTNYGSKGIEMTMDNVIPYFWVMVENAKSHQNPGRLNQMQIDSAIISAQPVPVSPELTPEMV